MDNKRWETEETKKSEEYIKSWSDQSGSFDDEHSLIDKKKSHVEKENQSAIKSIATRPRKFNLIQKKKKRLSTGQWFRD